MHIKATHQEHGIVFGTIDILRLPDDIVFVLHLDSAPLSRTPDDYFWIIIEQPTLSELVSESERLGLSDIEPLHKIA